MNDFSYNVSKIHNRFLFFNLQFVCSVYLPIDMYSDQILNLPTFYIIKTHHIFMVMHMQWMCLRYVGRWFVRFVAIDVMYYGCLQQLFQTSVWFIKCKVVLPQNVYVVWYTPYHWRTTDIWYIALNTTSTKLWWRCIRSFTEKTLPNCLSCVVL